MECIPEIYSHIVRTYNDKVDKLINRKKLDTSIDKIILYLKNMPQCQLTENNERDTLHIKLSLPYLHLVYESFNCQ